MNIHIKKQAEEAWNVVLKAIRDIGGYKSVQFEDPAIPLTISCLGGWITLCNTLTVRSMGITEKEFKRNYQNISKLKEIKNFPHCVGIFEAHNGIVEKIEIVRCGYLREVNK